MPDKMPYDHAAEQRLQRILRQVEKRLRAALAQETGDLDKIEQDSHKLGREVAELVEREKLEEMGSGHCGRTCACACGTLATYKDAHLRQIVTLNGVQVLARAYYWCARCKRGFCPLDARLKLRAGQCSGGVRERIARLCSYMPYRRAARELHMLCAIDVSASTLQRQAKATGERISQAWQQQQARLWAQQPVNALYKPSRAYVSMDGVLILVDKQWREVKLGLSYERNASGEVMHKQFYATLKNSQHFGMRLRTLAARSGALDCADVAVVADGGEWIWQETGKYFAQRLQILDYYHVSEHLWEVGRARFGEGSEAAKVWVGQQEQRLLEDRVGEVIADLTQWHPSGEAKQDLRRRQLAYLSTHAHRMRYKSYRDAGYHIGSGVIESGCNGTIQDRMKAPGMRWKSEGAEAMLHLRTAWCSERDAEIRAAARGSTGFA
jgi:Uncharacterised protein family (UPF0236)